MSDDDLVDRLRERAKNPRVLHESVAALLIEAADRIEELEECEEIANEVYQRGLDD